MPAHKVLHLGSRIGCLEEMEAIKVLIDFFFYYFLNPVAIDASFNQWQEIEIKTKKEGNYA